MCIMRHGPKSWGVGTLLSNEVKPGHVTGEFPTSTCVSECILIGKEIVVMATGEILLLRQNAQELCLLNSMHYTSHTVHYSSMPVWDTAHDLRCKIASLCSSLSSFFCVFSWFKFNFTQRQDDSERTVLLFNPQAVLF